MSVEYIERLAGPYVGDGTGQKTFSFGFLIFEESDVYVAVATSSDSEPSDLQQGTDYTVSMNADQSATPGGTITLTSESGLAKDAVLVIGSAVDYTQTLDLTNYTRFAPERITTELDRIVVMIQQIVELLGRVVQVPPTSSISPSDLFFQLLNAAESAAQSAEDAAASLAACEQIRQLIEQYSWDIPHIVDSLREVEQYPYDGLFVVGGYGDQGQAGSNISNRVVKAEGGSKLRTLGERFADSICAEDFGARGDGTTDDSEAFAALEQAFSGRIIDLHGKTFAVDELPELNRYVNGKFFMGGIYYPTEDFYNKKISRVSPVDGAYNSWPQDTAHVYNGVLNTFYQTASSHGSEDEHPALASSTNGGNSFDFIQHLNVTGNKQSYVFSAGCTEFGTQCAVMSIDVDHGQSEPIRLLGRRFYEQKAFDVNPGDVSFSTTNGSPDIAISSETWKHGLTVGDMVTLNVGGSSIPNDLVCKVTSVETPYSAVLTTNSGSNLTATENVSPSSGMLDLGSYTKFREFKFNNLSLGEAIKTKAGLSEAPIFAHSMCCVGDNAYITINSNTGSGIYLVEIKNISLETREIGFVKQISATGKEGSVTEITDGVFVGAIRGSETIKTQFYKYTVASDTVVVENSRFDAYTFLDSPVPCRCSDDYVVFAMSGSRARVTSSSGRSRGIVPIYIAYAKKKDIADSASFESKLRYEKVSEAFYALTNTGTANGVGVPSLEVANGHAFVFYGSEHPSVVGDRDGYPSVYCCDLELPFLLGASSKKIPLIGTSYQSESALSASNYSAPNWRDISFNAIVLAGSSVISTVGVKNLSAEFNSNAIATIFFMSEHSKGQRKFPIGHTYYQPIITPMGLGTLVGSSEQQVCMYYAPGAQRTSESFQVIGRTFQSTDVTKEAYVAGSYMVTVRLWRPVDWFEGF